MIKKRDKRAISIMIGYVLLISTAVIMSVVVYQWLKTYVPSESLECPSEVSLFIKSYTCDLDELSITLKNNGNFNIAGYLIRASTQEGQEIAATDLSNSLKEEQGGITYQSSSVLFTGEGDNSLTPNDEATNVFDVSEIANIYFIELIPMRFQTEKNKVRLASCSGKKIKEEIICE